LGGTPGGWINAVNGATGKRLPWPPVTPRDTPVVAGAGAVVTVDVPRLVTASNVVGTR
jgi:hypothetical protein